MTRGAVVLWHAVMCARASTAPIYSSRQLHQTGSLWLHVNGTEDDLGV